jgi:hypothetical protein
MKKYPKHIKAQLNRLMGEACERELIRELTQLATRFDEWRSGQITVDELNDLIHQYHQGSAREIYKLYNYGDADLTVARAVAQGLLAEDEIPADVWPQIEAMVQFCRGQ